tara:strand:- start:3860 stop:5218 length:1359 start_codon:yes stop_codon:yes gene_type:complete
MTSKNLMASLPNAIDAEESVIGTVLAYGVEAYEDVQPWIKTENVFYKEIHQELWKACTSLYKLNNTIDIITVKEKLNEMNLSLINKDDYGAYYLTGLTQNVIGKSGIVSHAKIVYEKYVQRQTAISSYSLFDKASDNYKDIQQGLVEHEKLIDELKSIQPTRKKDINDVMDDTIEALETSNDIIPFNYAPLDLSSRGMTRKEITILGGRPGHGKTTLMVNVISKLVKSGQQVMVFSREMSKEELMKKLLILESKNLEYSALRKPEMTDKEQQQLDEAILEIRSNYRNLTIYDNIRTLSESMREISRHKPDVIFDDYVQLIQVDVNGNNDRRFQIETIMMEYKWIVKKINASAFLLSQLNREIERRLDPEPKMSDYAESGVIEQVAETAMFVFYGYNFDHEEYGRHESKIIVAKSRYGQIGQYVVGFNGDRCKFYDNPQQAEDEVTGQRNVLS